MQNVLMYYAPAIRTQGAFYSAMGNARTSYLDVRDVAAVAAKALRSSEHDGKTYELNGAGSADVRGDRGEDFTARGDCSTVRGHSSRDAAQGDDGPGNARMAGDGA